MTDRAIPADSDPLFEVRLLASEHDAQMQLDLIHSTSWRVDGPSCQRRANFGPLMAGWFLLTVATLPVIIGGCVVFSQGEEGAGAASAVG